MRTSLTIARLIGPVVTVVGLGLLINGPVYREMVRNLASNHFMVYLTGVLTLLAGLAILNVHNVWARDWRTTVTVFGMFLTLMGAFRVLAPPYMAMVGGAILQQPPLLLAIGILLIGLGGFLTFKGYGA